MDKERREIVEVAIPHVESPEQVKARLDKAKKQFLMASIQDQISRWLNSRAAIHWNGLDEIMQRVCRLPLEEFYALCRGNGFSAFPTHKRSLSFLYLQFRRYLEEVRNKQMAA